MTDPTQMNFREISTLVAIMKALRTPVTGCPWDLVQTFETIAPYTIEEAYEVADAVQRGDRTELCDELGDLLLQPIFHAQLAAEENSFNFDDVIEAICTKLVRRHPHVFGDDKAKSAKLAKGFWDDIKSKEKSKNKRALDGVVLALPALTRAEKLQNKAAKLGFDWPNVEHVFEKISEEIGEVRAATLDKKTEEIGDLLFAVANLARHFEVDPEQALRNANQKFERRFQYIEDQLMLQNRTPNDSNLTEMDKLWDCAKANGL